MNFNPYESLRKEAASKAAHYAAKGVVIEAAWYRRMERLWQAASEAWMQRRKAAILEARRLATMPVATIAPPPLATIAPPLKPKPKRKRGILT